MSSHYTIIISDIQRLVIAKACKLMSELHVSDEIEQAIVEEAQVISDCLNDNEHPLQCVGVNDIS